MWFAPATSRLRLSTPRGDPARDDPRALHRRRGRRRKPPAPKTLPSFPEDARARCYRGASPRRARPACHESLEPSQLALNALTSSTIRIILHAPPAVHYSCPLRALCFPQCLRISPQRVADEQSSLRQNLFCLPFSQVVVREPLIEYVARCPLRFAQVGNPCCFRFCLAKIREGVFQAGVYSMIVAVRRCRIVLVTSVVSYPLASWLAAAEPPAAKPQPAAASRRLPHYSPPPHRPR